MNAFCFESICQLGFSSDGTAKTSFGSDMGTISVPSTTGPGNVTISVGRKLMRGSWNAEPWGPLLNEQVGGVKNGTDFYFNKSQFAGFLRSRTTE